MATQYCVLLCSMKIMSFDKLMYYDEIKVLHSFIGRRCMLFSVFPSVY